MHSVDELLNMAEVAEATLTETNDVIEIDADTRTMIIPDIERIFGVMSDEKGERKYFRCKRFVGNGIDLSKLDLRVIYQNASGLESGRDKYIVTDLVTDGEDYVTFSWELSRKVTAYKGTIFFIVCAIKIGTDGIITNEWNTTLANGVVLDGLEVSGTLEQEKEAYDYYKQLEAELEKKAQEVIGTIPSDYTQALKDVSNLKGEVTDGRTDVDGEVHKNIGDAMRGQARKLRGNVDKLKEDKVDKPAIADNNKIPRAKDGEVEWVEVGQPTDEQTNNAVADWLNEHPEATTTVQDGSITEQKIFSSFLPYIKNDYITPQMFGAKGDGVTDDTKAIQEAIVFCENSKRLLYIPSGVYIVSDTLIISKSIAILGSSVHRDVLSSYDKYMGISVLKFIAKSDKTLVVASEKAYDVSINSLVFLATSYEVHASGNISVAGDCKKYYEHTAEVYKLNGVNVEKTVRCSIVNCSFVGFSGSGITTGQHRHIIGCDFSHCNIAIYCTNYDNLIHNCWFRLCSICIYSNVNNTLFLSDSWFDQIEQIAIKYDEGGFMMISNCEFDLIEYCAIYSKYLYNSSIQGRMSRCGLYYGGFEPKDVPAEDEYKSCCIYSKSVSKLNNIQVNMQRREIKPGYGIAPSSFFCGAGMYKSNLILDADEEHVSKIWNFEDTNLIVSGRQCKARYSLKYNSVGCVSKDNIDPNGVYYSIDIGDIYISTSGNIYISIKKNSNKDWILIGSKSV